MISKNDFVFSVAELKKYLVEKGLNFNKIGLEEVRHPFRMMVPKYYLDLIDWSDPEDPLRKMVITSSLENDVKQYELTDPIGDRPHTPVPGIVHRYPDRCLLMLTNVCAVHCRFCFRKNLLNSNVYDFKKSMEYIKNHKEIWEVILSGGDPFMITDSFLEQVIYAVKQIKHVKLVRFHTRTPAVYPKRVTDNFVTIISQAKPSIIVFHINHPRELTPEFIQSIAKLKKTGSMFLSQTVLLKGVNDNTTTLIELFKGLVEIGIKPYYLHHLDYTVGTDYFRISVEEGKKIYRELSSISGHCIPEYVIDIPRGLGKIPVFWFSHVGKGKYEATDFAGRKVRYQDPF